MSATFESVASTREDYVAFIEKLKAETPSKKGERKSRVDAHTSLISALEERLATIDLEIAVSHQ
jgi:hypothetical protein